MTKEEKFKALRAPVPAKYLVEYEEDGKKFTGYHAQYAIDLLNDTFSHDWGTDQVAPTTVTPVGKAWAASVDIELRVDGERRCGSGAAYSRSIANATKAARTSAFKNACRYFGIGAELYTGEFEEDIVLQTPEEETKEELTADTKALEEKIKKAANMAQLESLKDSVEAVKGTAAKKLLYRKYDQKVIELSDV